MRSIGYQLKGKQILKPMRSCNLVFQQARTRAMLAALGIPLWGVRQELPLSVPVISLWGKQESEYDFDNDISNQISPLQQKVENVEKSSNKTEINRLVERSISQPLDVSIPIESKSPIKPRAELHSVEKLTRLPFAQTIATNEAIHVEQVIRFSLEARVIGGWVVLVSVQALNHPDRNALWKNISQALIFRQDSQEVCRFDWPLAEGARWQQNTGAQAALMGFLTRFGSERRMGLMGELPDSIVPDRVERLPSLDELLRDPLKKRSLWRLLIGNIR
jgi:hypothetical protein